MEIEVESCVRGHYVYSTIWNPVLGERLTCKRELDNVEDRYAVAICKDEDMHCRWSRSTEDIISLFSIY